MIQSISNKSLFQLLFRKLIPVFLLFFVLLRPSIAQGQQVCSLAAIKDLTGPALTDYLKASNYDCLRFLWTFSSDIDALYSDANMITALTELDVLAPDYQANNDQGILGIMLFVHVGFFHDSYNLILGSGVKQAFISTSNLLIANTKLTDYLNNDEAAVILNDWVQAIDAASLAGSYIATYTEILRVFEDHFEQFSTIPDSAQRTTHFGVLFSLGARAPVHDFNGKLTQDLIDRLEYLAVNTSIPDTYDYIPINAAWTLGQLIGRDPAMDSAIVVALTNALDSQPRLSAPWLWVVKALDQFNNCETSRPGESVCFSDVSDEVLAEALPYNYYFDDGTVVIRTSLDYDTVQTLYHAIKEVQGQFNRITETITPLTSDPNGVLTMIVYGSRDDYVNYQPLLFGLSTDNGGIYIEQDGTFYTYQRTPQESIYTLEELLRHEFVHYLTGRFTIQGFWGEVPVYDNNRLVWFDEGLAEFLAGSTNRSVDTRENMVRQIRSDSTRLSVDEILTATYGSFVFYRYAALFFDYLYDHDIPTLRQLFRLVRESDVTGYDALILQMRNDSSLESAYQDYLNEQVARYDSLTNPVTDEPLLDQLDSNDIAVIEAEFRKTRLGYSSNCSVASTQLNPRFSCRGVLTGPASNGSDADLAWRYFDNSLNNGIINEARRKSTVNNLHYLNCRMGSINFLENASGQFYPQSDFYCDGPLASGTYQIPNRVDRATSDFQSTRLGKTAVCQSVSSDEVECEVTLSQKEQDNSASNSGQDNDNTQANAQLEQVTADFQSTRVAANAGCELIDNFTRINCQIGATTTAFLESDPDQDVYDYLDADLATLRDDVFIINPDYYSGLSCSFTAGSTWINHYTSGGVNYKYGLGEVSCTVDVQDPEKGAIDEDLAKLQNQVYAIQPAFYRDLLCNFNGSLRVIPRPDNKNNIVRDVVCSIPANDDPLPVSNFFRIDPQISAQLEQVTADFQSTRLAAHAGCELIDNFTRINCLIGATTTAFLESDPDQDVYDYLDATSVTLRDDVFNINPVYYSGLSCNFIGGSIWINHYSSNGVDYKYGLGDVLCTIDVQLP